MVGSRVPSFLLSSSRPMKISISDLYLSLRFSREDMYSSSFSFVDMPQLSKGKPVKVWLEKPMDEKPFSMAFTIISSASLLPSHHRVWVWRFCFMRELSH